MRSALLSLGSGSAKEPGAEDTQREYTNSAEDPFAIVEDDLKQATTNRQRAMRFQVYCDPPGGHYRMLGNSGELTLLPLCNQFENSHDTLMCEHKTTRHTS